MNVPAATTRRGGNRAAPFTVLVVGARGIPNVEGGAEKNAEMLFPEIAAAGYRVVLIGLRRCITAEEYAGVELRSAPDVRFLNTDKLAYYLSALRQASRLRPDVVHLQGLGASLFLLGYKALRAKVVVRYGSADYTLSKWGPIGKAGFRFAEYQTRYADAIIAVSPALASRLSGKRRAKRLHIIPNAIDGVARRPVALARAAQTSTSASPYMLMVGRVTAQKNVALAIEAFARARAQFPKGTRLLVAGGLSDEAYVRALPRTACVELLGSRSRQDLEALYESCSVFLNLSVHEGSSNAVLEAIGRGCPIVLSDIPENRDFPLPGRLYVDPNDADAIGSIMAAAMREPDAFVADPGPFLSWADVARRTLAVYETVLA
jgi:glycosyltransferase involved in cell wall biosynthesis